MKKRILFSVASVLLISIVVLSIYISTNNDKQTQVVGEADGINIYYGEVYDQMLRNRAVFLEKFENEFQADVNTEEFWETEFKGKTPLEMLRQESLEEVKKYKVLQKLCVENGVLSSDETTYQAFLDSLEEQNKERESKINNQGVVYGSSEYTKDTYYKYLYSILEIELISKLSEKDGVLYATNKELKQYFNSIKDKYYKNEIDAEFYDICLDFSLTDITEDSAKVIMNDVLNIVKNDSNYKEVITEKYSEIQILDFTIDETNARNLQKESPVLYSAASVLKKGEASSAVLHRQTYHIYVCKKNISKGYQSFDENKETISMQYREAKFDELIDELSEKSKIILYDEFYNIKF